MGCLLDAITLRCGALGPAADPKDSCSLGTVKPDPAQEGSKAHTLSEPLIFYPTASKDSGKQKVLQERAKQRARIIRQKGFPQREAKLQTAWSDFAALGIQSLHWLQAVFMLTVYLRITLTLKMWQELRPEGQKTWLTDHRSTPLKGLPTPG